MHTQAKTQLSGVWQSLAVTRCVAHWQRKVSRSARLGLCNRVTVSGDAGWCPMRADLKASGGLYSPPGSFLLLEDRSLDGWMGEQIEGHSGKSRQFHFPSATLVQHQQAFQSLTYFCLYSNFFFLFFFLRRVSPISACFNQCKQRLGGFSDRAVGAWPPCSVTHQTFLLIWKAEWWVSMWSVRCWSERSGLSGCQTAAGASMLRETLTGIGGKDWHR